MPLKYTLLLTNRCNLACSYCYVGRSNLDMSPSIARQAVDFAFESNAADETLNIGFFGGEPLLRFPLMREITEWVESDPRYEPEGTRFSVVSNGTIFTSEIADFLEQHHVGLVISCDGAPAVHDTFRRFANGKPSSALVEATIRRAIERFSQVPVNAVFSPRTLRHLPETVEYLSSLGVRQIYLNPDFSAEWTQEHIDLLPEVYGRIADLYVDCYRRGDPHFISPIDAKISVVLRGGYSPCEQCRMGTGEFAFAPNGDIYPCERLVGNGDREHCIGNLQSGLTGPPVLKHRAPGTRLNVECLGCELRSYCMNWCGCSNFFSSGYYNRVNGFLCASEKATMAASMVAFETLSNDEAGVNFFEHLGGLPLTNSYRP